MAKKTTAGGVALVWLLVSTLFLTFPLSARAGRSEGVESAAAAEGLTFGERVKAQEAIERVYYAHRIWPRENPGPQPPFEEMVPRAQIEAKVADYLKKSAALGEYWQRPIEPAQLQAEMDRMVKSTKDPATLQELFAALDNDPYLIAECLARPVLADRLVRNWYAYDSRFHEEARKRAEELYRSGRIASAGLPPEARCERVRYEAGAGDEPEDAGAPSPGGLRVVRVSFEEFRRIAGEYDAVSPAGEALERHSPGFSAPPTLGTLRFRESEETFVVSHLLQRTEKVLEAESALFEKRAFSAWWEEVRAGIAEDLPLDGKAVRLSLPLPQLPLAGPCDGSWRLGSRSCPTGRYSHTAVWTGSEMVVWGGSDGLGYASTGGRYNPATDTWAATSTGANVPASRSGHTAVWTGSEMIVWGGYFYDTLDRYLNTGGKYNPSTDTWVPTSTGLNCPTGRNRHAAVWTGAEMIVWGGYGGSYWNTGGRYNPVTDAWTATSTGTNVPAGRSDHTTVWTGTEMIVWGGYYWFSGVPYYLNTGGRYTPATDTWAATSTGANVPAGRYVHTAVWTGTEMVVWGGYDGGSYFNTGGRYKPSTDTWTPTSTALGANAPAGRYSHTATWTGSEMIVWGGTPGNLNTGGRYNPAMDTWAATSTGANCPTGRYGHTVVWTGATMIVWGGYDGVSYMNTGGRYNPAADTWAATSTGANVPAARYAHTAVWTGSEMVVWGGFSSLNTGGRYNPATDTWAATSTGANCPTGRYGHTAVWTGSEMIVWGGYDWVTYWNTGGRYNPSTDTWAPTSTGLNCPAIRSDHTAVWTGTEVIVWGGHGLASLNTGGRYNPAADTWAATSTGANVPAARYYHTSVWTGAEMIVWSGYSGPYFVTGGRYNPSTNSWTATSTVVPCPVARRNHTAVWTGSEMIVWGGFNGSSLQDGGIYAPPVIPAAPAAPAFTAVAQTTLTVNWTTVTGAASYDVYRAAAASCTGAARVAAGVAAASYNDTGLACSTQYSYFIVAVSACGSSANGTCGAVTTAACTAPPEVSSGDTPATAQQWAADKLTVGWQAVTPATGYRLYKGTPADLPNLLTAAADACTRYDGATLTYALNTGSDVPAPGSFFWFLVTAYNGPVEGPAGNATAGPRAVNSTGACP